MVLEFSATLVEYFAYANNFAIKHPRVHQSWDPAKGWTDEDINGADPAPFIIPSYQRKLVWKRKDIEKLFASSGKLLGNITFARPKSDGVSTTVLALVDGLQRFSAITAIMRSLWNNVLADDAKYPNALAHFKKLKNNKTDAMPIIWQHNHNMLSNNTRIGIKDSYEELSIEIDSLIVEKLESTKIEDIAAFAEQVQNTLFNKNLAIDTYGGFTSDTAVIETFRDVNSTGVSLTHIDILRAIIIKQIEDLRWSQEDAIKAENDFTETLQPEKSSTVNKGYREIFGLRLYQAFKTPTNVFPDWASLTLKSLKTLFDYINDCETNQKTKVSDTEYKFPYLEEIFKCGSLPFISFIWYYYQNHYLIHLEEIKTISNNIKEKYEQESIGENDVPELSDEQIEIHVMESLDKLKTAHETIEDLNNKLSKENLTDSKKKKYEKELEILTVLKEEHPNYYTDLPDFLGGQLDTTEDALLFLRASYRRVMNGDVGTTAPILDRLMNKEIRTMQELANEFNPEESAGQLQNAPNPGWLRSSLDRKKGTGHAKPFFNACLLPDRNSGETEFNLLVYGAKLGQWNLDHLIPKTRIATGEGAIDGYKVVNLAPLDKAHNIAAQNIDCLEKIKPGGEYYANIMEFHPYCRWLVETHFLNHENDDLIAGKHPLNRQESIVHNPATPSLGDERIEQLIELLTPKL
jgi:hypothetical protein